MKILKSIKKYFVQVAGFFGLGVAASVSHAALPTAAGTAFTSLQQDVLDMIDLAWPVVAAVTVGFILLRVFKRAASSAV